MGQGKGFTSGRTQKPPARYSAKGILRAEKAQLASADFLAHFVFQKVYMFHLVE
jgi:hypothetical protein